MLLALIERLTRKPKPMFYLDTHAGRGWYDLHSHDAARGNEWREGIARIVPANARSEDLRRYLAAASCQSDARTEEPSRYPGSPVLAARQLRDIDRVVLVEQQIGEAQALERAFQGRRGASVICGDGYAALKTYLPPKENRGLVLIDPPYESGNEFADVERGLRLGLTRWPNGVFALWYPIKVGREVHRLHTALQNSDLRKLLLMELNIRPADSPLGLNGSGLIIANPPWQFDREMRPVHEELHAALARDQAGGIRVEWLVGE